MYPGLTDNECRVAAMRHEERLAAAHSRDRAMPASRRFRTPTALAAAVFAIAVTALVAAGAGNAVAARSPAPPAPTIVDDSAAARTAGLFTVAGSDFTPGGRVYLAIYDQMGAKLYETRWVVASAELPAEPGPTGHEAAGFRGGTLREAFGQLCGASAMMRALDEGPRTWSNWVIVEPGCDHGGYGPH